MAIILYYFSILLLKEKGQEKWKLKKYIDILAKVFSSTCLF